MTEQEELDLAVDRVLSSPSAKKLIVAGPGAGKTFLFKKVLERVPGDPGTRLVLTFINELKDDLERNLSDLASVYTLHGYCHYLLRRNPILSTGLSNSFEYFPDLPSLIKRDWEIVNGETAPHFVGLMRDLRVGSESAFYMARANYYDAIGYDDSVFRVHSRLTENPEQVKEYGLILIDEFQDFNCLEASFINLLSSVSPILIAGDDDQALYSQLRNSSPDFIRDLYAGGNFEQFELPFCMRCPAPIVTAVNAIVSRAKAWGCFKTRITKPFRHHTGAKGSDSKKYPFIQFVQCTVQSKAANYFGRYIASEVRKIPKYETNESHEKLFPAVLVIGSIQYLRQIEEYLRAEGFYVVKKEESPVSLRREEGLLRLKNNPKSNLGWRIVLEMSHPAFESKVVKRSITAGTNLHKLIPARFRNKVLEEASRFTPVPAETPSVPVVLPDKDSPLVKLVSYEGSKGLSAQHVFVVGVHEDELPHDARDIKDLEVCKFLVALTRTRKQCHVMTTWRFSGAPRRPSIFVSWLPSGVVHALRVSKDNVNSL